MYPDDPDVIKVQQAFFDPFEYLWARHKGDALNTEFKAALGSVAYQVACHQRVQNIGLKTRDVLNLISESEVTAYERCSGHDGVKDSGLIAGNITSEELLTEGKIKGKIKATSVNLKLTSSTDTHMVSNTLVVETGATLLGKFKIGA